MNRIRSGLEERGLQASKDEDETTQQKREGVYKEGSVKDFLFPRDYKARIPFQPLKWNIGSNMHPKN